ncbi:transposon Ty3-I Gag-Pol polyprotein [Trichonephila clavipes]|nr:transposon Ty3-I Gag-Pol polyprotein [Trichonephila clavipes]
MHPDATDPHAQMKNELINRSGESYQEGGRKLFSGEELGSRKPSELLRNKKRRAKPLNVDDKLMMKLFLQRLPSSVQMILAAISDLTLNKAADIADRIHEVSPSPIETFVVFDKKEQTSESKLFREIEKLNERIDHLLISRGSSQYRRNKNFCERNISNKRGFSICWFHRRFRKKCREEKCVQPCTHGMEMKPAKNNGDLFFAQRITSPVHS